MSIEEYRTGKSGEGGKRTHRIAGNAKREERLTYKSVEVRSCLHDVFSESTWVWAVKILAISIESFPTVLQN